ncbi:unnamed protein product [Symbiodinium necroappetens]|uniref:C2H2-type domain-containing protein n=1 Tax=Symbiodinium necroappetens TaxID=1628268 RepID=A0A813BPL3_9DINO|nr:unnamed protein product [Symbiodinium necroappetens]
MLSLGALSHNCEEQKQPVMKQRKRVWNRLENLISSLPYRIFQGSQHLDLKQASEGDDRWVALFRMLPAPSLDEISCHGAPKLDELQRGVADLERRLARQRKREQILQVLDLAETAAMTNQTRTHYQYVRMIAPKSLAGKMNLRDPEGNLLDPEQECQQLRDYAKGLFTGPICEPPDLEPLPMEWFTSDNWMWALSKLGNHKAVPQEAASIAAWRQCGAQVVQIAWLPKPNKSPTAPANLRTIGLMAWHQPLTLCFEPVQAAQLTLSSTSSRHLRKVLRIYERGVSNQSVLQQEGIDLWDDLGRRFKAQQTAIQLDSGRSTQLRLREGNRAEHLLQQFRRVVEVGQSRIGSSLQKNIPDAVSHPCPACGVYFGTKSGLEQHIHKKHLELEKQAQIVFDRAQHCLYGTPTCRFCRQRLTDWQSMRKHLTQGMCPALKTAFASGQTLEQILVEVIAEEAKDPPPPPAAEWKQETPLIQSQHEVLTVPNYQLAAHAKFIKSCTGQCVLCRQRVAGPGHIKTHWRTGHPAAWKRTSAAAEDYAFQQPAASKQDKSNPQCLARSPPTQHLLYLMVLGNVVSGIVNHSLKDAINLAKKAADKGDLELQMFQNYFPAGIDQASTAVSEGQQRGKGPAKEKEKQSQIRGLKEEKIRQLKESMFQLQRLTLRHEDYLGGFRPEPRTLSSCEWELMPPWYRPSFEPSKHGVS